MLKKLAVLAPMLFVLALVAGEEPSRSARYQSAFLRLEFAPDQPAFTALAVDSLGKNKLSVNSLQPPATPRAKYRLTRTGSRFEYRTLGSPAGAAAGWTFEVSTRHISLRSSYTGENPPPSLVLNFNPYINHATLLGLIDDDGSIRLPALLHLPDQGTFRITSSAGQRPALGYDAFRYPEEKPGDDYVKVAFPAATAALPQVEYQLEVVDIHPSLPQIEGDPRFDGFRRNWLNIFQLNPRLRVLANHAASDPCAFTVFEYSSVAVPTPPLAPGLTALALIRQTLDRYLSGMKAYGMAGYAPNDPTTRYDYLDTYPSLIIAAWDYERGSRDRAWLEKNYAGIKDWANKMLAMDVEGNGLLEYPASGNAGSWPERIALRPSNWWDTIGFAHLDAYSNALAYHALLGLTEMAKQANQPEDAKVFAARAEKLRSVYFQTFYNPATGVLAGWKSADGKLHDYYFTFVSGAAITYGLVPQDKANQIMDRLLAKMKEVGYTHFEYGLPGNLIPIRREDYVDHDLRFGGPKKADGSDGFQIYENGGATACYAYFTLQALYQLGRNKDADTILFPMLRGFEKGGFQGRGSNGMTNDWKAWDGTPHGYEGLLVDGYQALLAVLSR